MGSLQDCGELASQQLLLESQTGLIGSEEDAGAPTVGIALQAEGFLYPRHDSDSGY